MASEGFKVVTPEELVVELVHRRLKSYLNGKTESYSDPDESQPATLKALGHLTELFFWSKWELGTQQQKFAMQRQFKADLGEECEFGTVDAIDNFLEVTEEHAVVFRSPVLTLVRKTIQALEAGKPDERLVGQVVAAMEYKDPSIFLQTHQYLQSASQVAERDFAQLLARKQLDITPPYPDGDPRLAVYQLVVGASWSHLDLKFNSVAEIGLADPAFFLANITATARLRALNTIREAQDQGKAWGGLGSPVATLGDAQAKLANLPVNAGSKDIALAEQEVVKALAGIENLGYKKLINLELKRELPPNWDSPYVVLDQQPPSPPEDGPSRSWVA